VESYQILPAGNGSRVIQGGGEHLNGFGVVDAGQAKDVMTPDLEPEPQGTGIKEDG
jgi:hypothetical protein